MPPGTREVRAVLRLQKADHDHLAHRRRPAKEKGRALWRGLAGQAKRQRLSRLDACVTFFGSAVGTDPTDTGATKPPAAASASALRSSVSSCLYTSSRNWTVPSRVTQ